VEIADKAALYRYPKHPYTESLLAAAPRPEPDETPAPKLAMDRFPAAETAVSGCVYFSRCAYRQEICKREIPRLREIEAGHKVACHFDLRWPNAGSPSSRAIAEPARENRSTVR
jgi:oligopeptide/dipeptide ABC transporter ATP-binding protein